MRTYEFVIGRADAGLRVDRYLAKYLPTAVSRTSIQRVLRDGLITVAGRAVKVHYKLQAGETVRAIFNELPAKSTNAVVLPEPIPLEIVYEDDALLVVNKPPGLVAHPAPGHWTGTLVNAVLWHLQQQTAGSRQRAAKEGQADGEAAAPLPRAGLVHRLDKDTSGLLVIAKTERAHAGLSKQLKSRTMSRRYLAVVEGHLPMASGTVRAAIGRHSVHRKEMTVRHLGGKAAVTHYRVLARSPGSAARDRLPASDTQPLVWSLLEVSLETGRTHQIRVHMAHLGHPVAGDLTYGKHTPDYWQAFGIERQLLHAYAIRFIHPLTRQPVELTAPPAEDLRRLIPSVEERLKSVRTPGGTPGS